LSHDGWLLLCCGSLHGSYPACHGTSLTWKERTNHKTRRLVSHSPSILAHAKRRRPEPLVGCQLQFRIGEALNSLRHRDKSTFYRSMTYTRLPSCLRDTREALLRPFGKLSSIARGQFVVVRVSVYTSHTSGHRSGSG